MARLTIRLFGRIAIEREGRAVSNLHAGKLQELLCYLLLQRERPFPRETLAGLFWGECTTTQSRKYLRQALWQLQGVLNSGAEDERERILKVEPDSVGIDPQSRLWLDVDIFERSFSQAQGTPGHQLNQPQAEILTEAVQLYRGDLLEGWYQEWCLFQRERLQNLYLSMLDKLMCYCEVHHLYGKGLEYGERVLCVDRAHERTHQRMLRLLYLSGDRAGALRQYERCVRALAEELDVKPASRTIELHRQVCADRLEHAQSEHSATYPDQPAESFTQRGRPSLTEILNQLRCLQGVLASAHEQLQKNIHAVERSLRQKPAALLPEKRKVV
jgi:DNA-binding SARP family transcriptional activator